MDSIFGRILAEQDDISRYTYNDRTQNGENRMQEKKNQDKRIFAGFYRRYDGKLIYVVSTAKDVDSGEEIIIFLYYDSNYPSDFFTCSKASFCETVLFNNKKVQKYRRQTQFHIRDSYIDFLDEKMCRGPKRKKKKAHAESNERYYQSSRNYLDYAMDLCKNYKRDLRIYSLCKKHNRLVGVAREDFPLLQEDIRFLHSMLETDLKDYKEYFIHTSICRQQKHQQRECGISTKETVCEIGRTTKRKGPFRWKKKNRPKPKRIRR